MVSKIAKSQMPKPKGQAFKDKSKPADIRLSNINAAKGNLIGIFNRKCVL